MNITKIKMEYLKKQGEVLNTLLKETFAEIIKDRYDFVSEYNTEYNIKESKFKEILTKSFIFVGENKNGVMKYGIVANPLSYGRKSNIDSVILYAENPIIPCALDNIEKNLYSGRYGDPSYTLFSGDNKLEVDEHLLDKNSACLKNTGKLNIGGALKEFVREAEIKIKHESNIDYNKS